MHDIDTIRSNPEKFDQDMNDRKVKDDIGMPIRAIETASDFIQYNDEFKKHATELQALQKKVNDTTKYIKNARNNGTDMDSVELTAKRDEIPKIKEDIKDKKNKLDDILEQLSHLAYFPNALMHDVPRGSENVEIRRHGMIHRHNFKSKPHYELGKGMDFKTASNMSGSRFVILRDKMALLSRALGQFMLNTHTMEHGYEEINPPLMVRYHALYGTGQLPKFDHDMYRLALFDEPIDTKNNDDIFKMLDGRKTESTDSWMIPTAEVPLTNIAANSIWNQNDLPMRFVALTHCFRSEAGASGKDTKGMLRQHQFEKCELVSIVTPEESENELERMTECAEKILQLLDIPYRVVSLCSEDIGFSAMKTYDIEVWLPGAQEFREISSCSLCGNFQAHRMNARYRNNDNKLQFLHTLNGSGVAVGRCLIALLENHQQENGKVTIPEVLRPLMNGLKEI